MATSNSSKNVVKSAQAPAENEPKWEPRPEDRAQANKLRIFAIVCWVLAIALECVVIFGLLFKNAVSVNSGDDYVSVYPFLWMNLSQNALFVWCIVLIVICGVLAIIGSQLWKKANRLDPASVKQPVRFFVQNQLGAIISAIAFIPLVILVLLSKNLQGVQKGVVTGVAVVVLGASVAAGVTTNSPSQEQYNTESSFVVAQNGTDVVYWVKGGSTYHLCQDSTDLSRPSKDNQIYSGTVGQAHGAGMSRLALRNECGYDNSKGQSLSWTPSGTAPTNPADTTEPTDTPS
ncbi:MAG: G-protein coupled receptor [Propionibacteriaceae bacterium]|nr:G-protein coupled receptor [Propionibacteriaceae bacterium]